MNGMPKLNMNGMDERTKMWAETIVRQDDTLRASKPKVVKGDIASGTSAYIWRMVAFYISPRQQHQCMPVMAECDLQIDYSERRKAIVKLDEIVQDIVDCVPRRQQHGVNRWGQAFGMTGTPRYNDEGAVIYR